MAEAWNPMTMNSLPPESKLILDKITQLDREVSRLTDQVRRLARQLEEQPLIKERVPVSVGQRVILVTAGTVDREGEVVQLSQTGTYAMLRCKGWFGISFDRWVSTSNLEAVNPTKPSPPEKVYDSGFDNARIDKV